MCVCIYCMWLDARLMQQKRSASGLIGTFFLKFNPNYYHFVLSEWLQTIGFYNWVLQLSTSMNYDG